jgi:hypothetical protein
MSFVGDIFRQLIGASYRRDTFRLSWFANVQRNELGVDLDTIADIFKHGREVKSLVRNYRNYSISISYRWDQVKSEYVITSVRRYEKEANK